MIRRLRVKNYRSLADIDIALDSLTVLVGYNGSGKSTLVDVLRFVQDALRFGLDTVIMNRHGIGALRHRTYHDLLHDIEILLEVETASIKGWYTFTLESEQGGGYTIKREALSVTQLGEQVTQSFESYGSCWLEKPEGLAPRLNSRALVLPLLADMEPYKYLYDFIEGMSFYNIFPNSLKEPQKAANPYPLNEHGTNLASTLRYIHDNSKTAYQNLVRSIQDIIPGIVDFHVRQISSYFITYIRREIGAQKLSMFNLSQESDGTLRMLGILTALHQVPARTLIVLEEPELTIHPGILHLLWNEIEDAAKKSQIILTTHSPDLLDLCEADSLRIVEMVDGCTQIGKVDEIQQQAIQKNLVATGELLRAQGLRRATQQSLGE